MQSGCLLIRTSARMRETGIAARNYRVQERLFSKKLAAKMGGLSKRLRMQPSVPSRGRSYALLAP